MSTASRVLIVEDDPGLRAMLVDALAHEGYACVEAASLAEARQVIAREVAHAIQHRERGIALVLLDLNLPDGSGESLLPQLRRNLNLPVLVISARHEDGKKIQLLDGGADDYLVKPFSVGELLARMRVALRHQRRNETQAATAYCKEGIRFDPERQLLSRDGEVIHLTRTELALLNILCTRPGQVCTHRQLLKDVWGAAYVEHTHYLRIYMAQLRAKLERNPADPRILLTETGIGYRLAEPDSSIPAESGR